MMVCVLVNAGSGNDLSLVWRQAITYNNAELLSAGLTIFQWNSNDIIFIQEVWKCFSENIVGFI